MHVLKKVIFAASCVALSSCSGTGDGVEPPLEAIYFPVGLSLDRTGQHLFVANSDFDLQFNGGSLQSLDTNRILEFLPKSCPLGQSCADRCGELGQATAADQILVPGPCSPVDLASPQDGGRPILTDAVKIGAFATDLVSLTRPVAEPAGHPGRLFLPLRGSASMMFVDTASDGSLECGADGRRQCAPRYVVDAGVDELGAAIELPREPAGLAATEDGKALLGIHQLSDGPQVSVFEHDWSAGLSLRSVQTLAPTIFGSAFRPGAIASVPIPKAFQSSASPAFLLTGRTSPEVRLVKFLNAEAAAPEAAQAREVGRAPVDANSIGSDSRGIAVDASARQAAEASCAVAAGVPPECLASGGCAEAQTPAYFACLSQAALLPTAVFVANRTPASLLLGEVAPPANGSPGLELPTFKQTIPLTFGPSRVVLGKILNEAGELESRVFVLCFDSRLIFVYDPVRGRIETEIRTGRGPHSLVVDEERNVAYVAHFTDSYLGVIDLNRAHTGDYAKIVLSVGRPSAPRASK
ncbi:MAG: hypothetical protein SFV15_01720 [Polyangiaceae bacterium]|nr:hypothetical protein [Polyangiaceae bacterium]